MCNCVDKMGRVIPNTQHDRNSLTKCEEHEDDKYNPDKTDQAEDELEDGRTYVTFLTGDSITRVDKDDPSRRASITRPGVRNLNVDPIKKWVFYTQGRSIYSEPLAFSDEMREYLCRFILMKAIVHALQRSGKSSLIDNQLLSQSYQK